MMTVYELPRMRWNVHVTGAGPPVLLLHGFTGSGESWGQLSERLAGDFMVVRADLPGHGKTQSPGEANLYTMENTVDGLLRIMDELGCQEFFVIGYSMGGRIALSLTIAHPDRVSKLILESASPGLKTEQEREERRIRDEALAERIEQRGIQAFVDEWERLPLFQTQLQLPAETRSAIRATRLGQSTVGLANSLRAVGTGVQPPLWERIHELNVPTLLITGALDNKFCAIAREMLALASQNQVEHIVVPNAGHTVHVEQFEQYCKAVQAFLKGITWEY